MSTRIFFCADTHFSHKALVEKGHRKIPFDEPTIEKHDNMIIERWNDVVCKNDTVYHLGDFAWHNLAFYRKQLKGRIHLIKGNHDRLKSADHDLFESVSDFKRVKVGDQKIYMMHYCMRTFPDMHYGSWQLYGHSHGSLVEDPHALSFDVGMDCWAFTPISYEQVKEKMDKKKQDYKPVDHHAP
mgnify:CR=1 FL=1